LNSSPSAQHIEFFEDTIRFGNYDIHYNKERKTMECRAHLELDTEDVDEARIAIARNVEENLLSILILTVDCVCGLNFNPESIQLRSIKPKGISGVFSNVVRIHVIKPVIVEAKDFLNMLNDIRRKIDRIAEEKRSWFLRALRFWNRGAVEHDPIDKFLNHYIALEILAARVAEMGELNDYTIEKLKERYCLGTTFFKYDSRSVYWLRNNLLHGGRSLIDHEKPLRLLRGMQKDLKQNYLN